MRTFESIGSNQKSKKGLRYCMYITQPGESVVW